MERKKIFVPVSQGYQKQSIFNINGGKKKLINSNFLATDLVILM